ncbi:LCP family protein [Jiangella asiatica]|nr:LCP family protein [Jiangella asiatica]
MDDPGGRRRGGRGRPAPSSAGSYDPARRGSGALRPGEYRRFLRQVSVGSLVPGLSLISAGRKVLGWFVLILFLAAIAGAVVLLMRTDATSAARMGTDPDTLTLMARGLLALAVIWLVIAVVGLYLLQPEGLRAPQRLLSAVLVITLVSLMVVPISFGSRYAFRQLEFIDNVFADDDQHSLTIPDDATEGDPWAGQDRVNVLILGSDSGPGRDETRTDTVMVASIDTRTGDTALFSLPRNLLNVPMPEGTPLHEAYPDGFSGPEEDAYYWLSAMYRFVPHEFPEFFEGIADPGAETMKLVVGEALGLDISYYVMVNLRGFQYLVDALGGVELDVPYRIPIGTKEVSGGCTEASGWIEPGENQHLDGYHALWFARARCGPGPVSDDYERMRRQRCVIGAIAAQADPFNLLTRYQELATAAEETMSTDIPASRLSDFAELALEVQETGIRSLPFTDDIIEYHEPNYDLIREFVQESLEPPRETPAPSETSSPDPTDPDEPSDTADPTESPADEDPTEPPTEDPTEPSDGESGTPGAEETPDESDGAQSIAEVC